MVYYDSQLFSVDGIIQTLGASYTIDLSNLMYCVLSKAKDNSDVEVDTFMCIVEQPNRSGLTQVQYRRNSRSMSDFLSDMNAIGGGEPLKLWTNLRSFSGKELFANNLLYDSTVILNDNFQSNCIYSASLDKTSVYIGSQRQISPTVFLVLGNQIGSAPLVDEIVLPVYDGLSAQGTTSSTTTVLRYGVNVIETVTPSNYAAKLPQPITGKSVKVVNNGAYPLSLFPSNIGGQINNYPINTPAQVPNNGILYEFICTENPLPGAWTWTAPATNQIQIAEMAINHTNGTPSSGYGSGTVYAAGGFSLGQSGGSLYVIPANLCQHFNFVALSSKSKYYTNIVAGDCVGNLNSQCISVERIVEYLDSPSSATNQGLNDHALFGANPGNIRGYDVLEAPIGTLNNPPEVGDTGTFYTEIITSGNSNPNLGTGGIYSGYYWYFAMVIPASAATKIYKFQIFVEYY